MIDVKKKKKTNTRRVVSSDDVSWENGRSRSLEGKSSKVSSHAPGFRCLSCLLLAGRHSGWVVAVSLERATRQGHKACTAGARLDEAALFLLSLGSSRELAP